MQICSLDLCTGCFACVNICKHNAIEMKENEKGFLYPRVDESKCVKCGLCVRVCPSNDILEGYNHKKVLASLVRDDTERAKSTSGGIFACLAKEIIKKDGYVYGAVLCDDLAVRHIEAHDIAQMDKMRNSKYVQSEIGFTYRQAKGRLDEGHHVLFSGTPCQISGLKKFLRRDYDKLITIDILCHGVPSPGIFRKYVESEEKIAGAKMTDIKFRSKAIGWKKLCTERLFSERKADWSDTFVPGFLADLYLRESCYQCQYATDKRQSDITLGDYWCYLESGPEYIEDDDKGISLVIINTDKGEWAIRKIKKYIVSALRSMKDAKRGNIVLSRPSAKPDCYNSFWEDAQSMEWSELADKYIQAQNTDEWMSSELREYYSQPFDKRHRKHKIRRRIKDLHRKINRFRGKI